MNGGKKFIGLLLFVILIKDSLAFLSPSNLTIFIESAKGILINLAVAGLIFFIIFFKKIKKNYKKHLIIVFFIILLISFVFFVNDYIALLKLNNPTYINKESIDDTKIKLNHVNISLKTLQNYSRRIDMNTAFSNESFKKITYLNYQFENTVHSNFFEVIENYKNEKKIHEYMKNLDITANDSVVLFCHDGFTSKFASSILNYYGYNTYHATIYENSTTNFTFQEYIIGKYTKQNTDILIKEISFDSPQNYVFVIFDPNDQFILLNKDLLKNTKDKLISISVQKSYPSLSNSGFSPDKFISEKMLFSYLDSDDTQFLCYLQLHCFLTRNFIESHNLSVDYIYQTYETSGFEYEDVIDNVEIVDKLLIYDWD